MKEFDIRQFFESISMSERLRLYEFFKQELRRRFPNQDWDHSDGVVKAAASGRR